MIAASLAAAVSVGCAAAPAAPVSSSRCPWVTSTVPIPQRVSMVLAAMTVRQLDGLVFGQGSSVAHGYAGHIPAIPSLCIPQLNLEDGPEGVGDGMTGVTQLPAAVAAAATWDPSAVRSFGEVIGSEDSGKGVDVDLGPTVNIVRDPRWGRAFESYGEDPYLSGQTAVADITGVQSQGVMAMVKHWAVYNQETNRNHPQDDAIVSDRAMREIYLPQFQAAVQPGHAAAVMCSYATVNGIYACENPSPRPGHGRRVRAAGLHRLRLGRHPLHRSLGPGGPGHGDAVRCPLLRDRWCRRCRTARYRWRRCGRWPGASSLRCSGSTCSARAGPGPPGRRSPAPRMPRSPER